MDEMKPERIQRDTTEPPQAIVAPATLGQLLKPAQEYVYASMRASALAEMHSDPTTLNEIAIWNNIRAQLCVIVAIGEYAERMVAARVERETVTDESES